MFTTPDPRPRRRFVLASLVIGLLTVALTGGCPDGSGLFAPTPADGSTPTSADGSDTTGAGGDGSPATTGTPLDNPDPAEASAIIERQPGTVAFAETEDGLLVQAIDDDGGVHEFVMTTDASGQETPLEYRYESDSAALSVRLNDAGEIEHFYISDTGADSWVQVALSWSDATHALVNMKTSAEWGTSAFEIELDEPLPVAKAFPRASGIRTAHPKLTGRAEPTAEQRLSLPVRITYKDASGNVVSGLRPIFRLRSAGGRTTFGMAVGREALVNGTYSALIPAYGYGWIRNDYPMWKPDIQWASYTVSSVLLLLVAVPPSAPVAAAFAVADVAGGTLLPAVLDRVLDGQATDVPYPTALGQDVQSFEVRVSAGDRNNTTLVRSLTYDEMFEQYVEPREFFDLGTVVVEPEFEPKAPEYRLYLLTQIGPGQLEVLPEGSENEDLRLCDFEGGGMDCATPAVVRLYGGPFATGDGDAYTTKEEAVRSLCPYIKELMWLPLGVGPAVEFTSGEYRYLSRDVYNILDKCFE